MPRDGATVEAEVRGADGSCGAGCPSNRSIRDARSSRWSRREGRGAIADFIRLARRPARSALTGYWRDAGLLHVSGTFGVRQNDSLPQCK